MDEREPGSVPRLRGRAWLRRPAGLVAQTRWLFYLTALASLALTLLHPLVVLTSATLPLLVVGCAVLVGSWSYRYRTRRDPIVLDMGEAAAVSMMMVAQPEPAGVFAFVYAALWFRALYGSTRSLVLFAVFLGVGAAAALPLWGLVPGRDGEVVVYPVLAALSVMALIALVARYVAQSLFAREEAQRRDAALVRLGHRLIGLTDGAVIRAVAHDCAAEICTTTPGLRSLVTVGVDGTQLIVDHTGDFHHVPVSIPRADLPPDSSARAASQVVVNSTVLVHAAGTPTSWLAIPLPDEPDSWVLVGAPRRVPPEAVVAFQSLANQVALALRSSAAHQDLTIQAHADPLTGLANRAAFATALNLALTDHRRRVALLFLDFDDFKTVNDALGHAAGDELLRQIADRLRGAVRPRDLCARLGGDEFAVLLVDADDIALVVAQRLVELIGTPVSLRGRLAQVGASIGLAFSALGTSAEDLVQQADIAMYAAKAKGKNRVQIFDPGLLHADNQTLFEAELEAAVGLGQIAVHYQPIVSIGESRCVAVEALVRWQHPTRGVLAPAEFIGTAERTGAIVGIGAFVLRRACADTMFWSRLHGPLAIHVNVSAAQLTDPGLPAAVRACISDFELAPRQLVLEITESMVLDSPVIRSVLDVLVDAGVALAVDDFGIGYSALSTLRTLPLTIVKIDKSFLLGGADQVADEAVVEAIVVMANRLGLQIVAEGVERVDQQQFLLDVGADAVQGYLHLRPSPAPVFERWLDEQAAPHVEGTETGSPLERGRTA